MVGNVLEWYDFAVFGFFAPLIAELFFPGRDQTASLLATFGIFAGAYFMRPLGGVLFGQIGDRLGRKRALQLSVMMMALPTTLIGLLPTHVNIGVAASVLLLLLRMVQGLSVGGELIGSITYLTESAPPGRRGWVGSFALCSSTAGVLLGSLVAANLQATLSAEALISWGWRLPFLSGIVIGVVGLWMRNGIPETPAFERLQRQDDRCERPLSAVLSTSIGPVLHVAALVMLVGGGFYLLFVWWPTLLSRLVDPPVPHAMALNTAAMAVLMICIPVAGALSDIVGRGALMRASASLLAVLAYPLFTLVERGTFASALTAQLLFAVLLGLATGPAPAAMVELFETRLRYTGLGIGYNLSLSLFGGTAPLIGTWLVARTGQVVAPAYYLAGLAVATATAAHLLPAAGDTALAREEASSSARRTLTTALAFPMPRCGDSHQGIGARPGAGPS